MDVGHGVEKVDHKSFPRPKSRKAMQKTIVRLKIEDNGVKQKGEGPPSDYWSWRKYGQKPIKGSPHPRGYYKCSTSKGCSAKKQVERCRTDASVLIITYTSTHNHPGPNLPPSINGCSMSSSLDPLLPKYMQEPAPNCAIRPRIAQQEYCTFSDALQLTDDVVDIADLNTGEDSMMGTAKVGEECSKVALDPTAEEIIKYSASTKLEEENDFYDDLEELPISSSFTGLMRSSQLFEERFSSYSLLA